MANGRFLSKSVATDIALNSLSGPAREVYLMAIPHLDVDGIIAGNPDVLWAMTCPLLPYRDRMPDIISEWIQTGLVIAYDSDTRPALFFKGFSKNQRIRRDRESSSEFTIPPGYVRDDSGQLYKDAPEDPGSSPGVVREDSPLSLSLSLSSSLSEDEDEGQGEAAAPPSSSLRRQVFDRLAGEWDTVNKTQVDKHSELAERYSLDAWRTGFDATKRGARASPAYVEKVIISEREKRRSTNGAYSDGDDEPIELDPELVQAFAERRAAQGP